MPKSTLPQELIRNKASLSIRITRAKGTKMTKLVCMIFILLPAIGYTQTIDDCDLLYSKREYNLITAQDCYQNLYTQNKLSHDEFFDRSFINLSTAVSFFEKKAEERMVLDKAFVILNTVKNIYGENSYYNYWKAVWVSFDALEKDRGKMIPTYLFTQIGTIQNLLKSSANTQPSIHFYGPYRVLGLLHTQMPKIAGGDKKYAEQMLKLSFTADPYYHSNPYAYANILYINGKLENAKDILNTFIKTPNEKYESFPNEPLRSFNLEIQKEKAKAQELLKIIIDEE